MIKDAQYTDIFDIDIMWASRNENIIYVPVYKHTK